MSEIKTYIQELESRVNKLESKIESTHNKIRDEKMAFEHKKTQLLEEARLETADYKGKKLDFSYNNIFDNIDINLSDVEILTELKNIYKI